MGVQGLTTYVNSNQELFLKYHILHDTPLVIDGYSLCAQLYESLNCFPGFGGDYDMIAACVKSFFDNLKKCNVVSYVLFDGSYENRKLKTVYSRLRSRIKRASRLDPSSLKTFPLLIWDVFVEVLTEMKIPYTVCEYEADDEIAAMARQLNCPVLSYDSDFFIYNVLYIPFNTLRNKVVAIDDDTRTKINALECKIYQVKNLVDNFVGLKEEMMPLFAILVGNDYVQKRKFKKFFSQLKLTEEKTMKNEQQRSIHSLLKWLQNESLDSAIAKVTGGMKNTEKSKLYKIIKNGMDGYNRKYCHSLKYFNLSANFSEEAVLQIPEDDLQGDEHLTNYDSDEDKSSENDETDDGSSDETDEEHSTVSLPCLPEWFAEKIRQKSIPMTYINLYTLHIDFSFPQAEDYDDDDAFLCVLNILRLAFDIMTDFSHEYCLYISREKNFDYKKVFIGKEYSMTRLGRLFEKKFCDSTDEDLRILFTHFLREKFNDLDLCHIDSLPSNFRLVMLSILWWVKHCNVPASFIHSLFISFIMLDVIDEKTGNFRDQFYFNRKHFNKLADLKKGPFIPIKHSEIVFNKNKVMYEDCLVAASILLEHFEIKKRPKTYDVKKVHKFAQFQCCLHQFNCLSTLCGKKYENTVYSKFYNGTFVYNITSILKEQNDSQSFIEQYLKGANSVIMYFNSLCSVYKSCADQLGFNDGKKMTRQGCKNDFLPQWARV